MEARIHVQLSSRKAASELAALVLEEERGKPSGGEDLLLLFLLI